MRDFKCIAKTGNDFAIICFEKVAEEVETTVIEVFMDGMRMKAHLCDESESSWTLTPLPNGDYKYTVTQISSGKIYKTNGSFTIIPLTINQSEDSESLKEINNKLDKIIAILNNWGSKNQSNDDAHTLAAMKNELDRLLFQQQNTTMSSEKEKALVKRISELSRAIKEMEKTVDV